ncbi:MAG: hypothetical protein ACR2KG_03360 [Nocardioidaceae bacterium]
MVDTQVARWAHSLSLTRLEAIIHAVTIYTASAGAAKAVQAAEAEQGVWVTPSSEHGNKTIFIRTDAPNAIWFDATIDRIADGLGTLGDQATKQVRRSHAVGVIAHPQRTLDLFDQTATLAHHNADPNDDPNDDDDHAELADSGSVARPGRRGVDSRPPATLYVHLTDTALVDGTGVARVEGVGPVTVDQVRRFLGHCQVRVKPVLDLPNMAPVDAYEIPDRLREATWLRSPVDVFPYATNTTRRRDIDHTITYRHPDTGGPPGQTNLANLGPMTRLHHRIKTFGRWQVRQPFNGVFIWRSPHGRLFFVDHTGTQRIPPTAA